MASVTSNRPEIDAVLDGLAHLFDLNKPRRGRRLGDDAADTIAAGIQARTLDQQKSPGGGGIPANRGKYGTRKRARGVKVGVGLYGDDVGGEMLEFAQVRGQVTIGEGEMEMQYGLDEDCRQKAEWFTEGNPANNQPPRPFYELDSEVNKQLDDLFDEAAEDGIADLGGA